MAKSPAFRIAMRTVEDGDGTWWVALLARIENMDDSLELGRIRRGAVGNPQIRAKFIETCQLMIEDVLKDKLGIVPVDWQQQKPMPPSEGKA